MVVDLTRNIPISVALAVHEYEQTSSAGARLKALKSVLSLVRELAEPRELQSLHKENMMELVTIRTLISMNAFHHLPEQGSISSQEIARKVGAGESMLLRLLRMAASAGIVEQYSDKTFAHTKFGRAYAAEIGTGIAFQVFYDESFQPLTKFHQYLKEKDFQEPDVLEHSPALWATNNEGESYWDIMQADPERLAAFQKGMRASQKYLSSTGPYDFGHLAKDAGDRPVLVDVGGGHGQTINEILKAHPVIPSERVILQDLPKVVEAARENKILPESVEIMEYNYNDLQPIKGAKAYFFRRVFHSSSDKMTSKLLKNVVPAMANDSVVLIADYIVPDPVPANEIGAVSASVAMMTPAGKERTIEDFRNVLDDAGLELTGVFQSEDDNFGLVEARLKAITSSAEKQVKISSVETSPIAKVSDQVSLPPVDFDGLKLEGDLTIVDYEF